VSHILGEKTFMNTWGQDVIQTQVQTDGEHGLVVVSSTIGYGTWWPNYYGPGQGAYAGKDGPETMVWRTDRDGEPLVKGHNPLIEVHQAEQHQYWVQRALEDKLYEDEDEEDEGNS
jgi:hypothetical protein